MNANTAVEVELTLERLPAMWWSLTWRAVLGAMLVGMVLGAIRAMMLVGAGDPPLGRTIGVLLGWLAYIPVSIWALRAALRKTRPGFRVVLVREAD